MYTTMDNPQLQKEKELFNEAKKNKEQGFYTLFRYYVDDVYRYAFTIVGNKFDAEDITQQTFAKFYNEIHDLRWEDTSLIFWFFITARKICFEKYPTNFSTGAVEEKNLQYLPERVVYVDAAVQKGIADTVQSVFPTLLPVERETINLRIWEEMHLSEITLVQNSGENTIRWRFNSGLKKIFDALGNEGYDTQVSAPDIYTAIRDLGESPEYKAPQNLLAAYPKIQELAQRIAAPGKSSNKAFLVLLATVVVALLAAVGILGYMFFGGGGRNDTDEGSDETAEVAITPTPEETVTPTESPEPTPTETTTEEPTPSQTTEPTQPPPDLFPGWGTYTNDRYDFSLRYPQEWQVAQDGFTTNCNGSGKPCGELVLQKGDTQLVLRATQEGAELANPDVTDGDVVSQGRVDFGPIQINKSTVEVDGEVRQVLYNNNGSFELYGKLFYVTMRSENAGSIPSGDISTVDRLFTSFENVSS